MIHFDHSPDLEKLGTTFGESPYFGIKAVNYREKEDHETKILVACVGSSIVGALTWSIPIHDGRLNIGMVEVHPDHRGKEIGSQLLLEAERFNTGKYHGCLAYLSDARNTHSRNMFLKAGYTEFDSLKLYK